MRARCASSVVMVAAFVLAAFVVPGAKGESPVFPSRTELVFHLHLFDTVNSQDSEVLEEIGLNATQAQVLIEIAREYQSHLTDAETLPTFERLGDMIRRLYDGLDEQGDQLVSSYIELLAKPATDPFERACRRLKSTT